ncbi:2312_t:CDS:2, partial [Acaulospora morrowiae]
QNWRSLSKMFAQRLNARVYALDLRNHGESPHSKAHSYEVMAEDVAAFIREHRLKKIVVLGHSMGGKVAMTMALRQEQQLDRLVVVDSAPVNSRISQEFKRYIDVMKKIEQVGVVKQSQADEIMKNYIPEITIRQFLLTNLKKDSTTGQYKFRIPLDVLDDSLGTMSEFPFDSAHHTFHKKTLFISGLRSDYVTPKV